MKKTIYSLAGFAALLALGFAAWVYSSTYHPAAQETAELSCPTTTPEYDARQGPLSVMSYNVQFFAGKQYVFYFDMPDNQGPDTRPSSQDIATTISGIAALLKETAPDIVFLQEVHDGAAATDHGDQLAELLKQLPANRYPCIASTYYWKADYIPHPQIMGSVGMKLVTLSRYKLSDALRHRLPQPPMDIVSAQFYLKRAILEARLPTVGGPDWQLFNTHFDAFAQGSDTMEQQVDIAASLMQKQDRQDRPFILGGDLNLLMPGQLAQLQPSQRYLYQENTELRRLLQWPSVPSVENIQSEAATWFTHYPNDPDVSGPDRTLDYLFYSQQLSAHNPEVINTRTTQNLSDHLPVWAGFSYPNNKKE
ncbi:endonuclease/exonuclease/phosphatase family protein [Oceanobacter sp. 4_MG-2023]|uniref:endonuclease/exonuclease/phosphatase family protein n=1 Tax=Oceanobacter sp. 4_MG-2023 TaxID=3062623 RepID=UPI00273383EE|nr:endonuclease/exonuclease/phosphatase family protein [Oceanobacter sp. 4_MG-2023]MDP2546731.1 endonuclease/exonuclease/phosphatase family protein [Oceanobacter sp. 4_MG-2023]